MDPRALLAGLAAVWLAGCDSGRVPTYPAGGRVVFSDGKPMNSGRVEFRPVDSEHLVVARATIEADGTFQLSTFKQGDGAIEGEHEVLARPMVVVGGTPPPGMPVFEPDAIDEKFTQFSTSEIRFTVTKDPSKNEFKIVVERP